MKQKFLLPLDLQLFGEDDEHDDDSHNEDDLDEHEAEEEVIENEDVHLDGGSHRRGSGGLEIHQTLEADYWKQFLDLMKMQNEKTEASHEKIDKHLEALSAKLEDLDRRHQQVPASVRAEIESLFEAHKEAGNIDEHAGEPDHKRSKYQQRHSKKN